MSQSKEVPLSCLTYFNSIRIWEAEKNQNNSDLKFQWYSSFQDIFLVLLVGLFQPFAIHKDAIVYEGASDRPVNVS